MTYDPAKALLMSVYEARTESSRLRGKLNRLKDQTENITSAITGMPHSGNADAQKTWAALADVRAAYEEKLIAAELTEYEVSEFIDKLPTETYRIILRRRYLDCLRWPEVEASLAKDGVYYEIRQIYRLHGEALNEARALWAAEHEGEIENET